MNKAIKWGVIGCGNIAHKFVEDLQYVNNSQLYAIASTNNHFCFVLKALNLTMIF